MFGGLNWFEVGVIALPIVGVLLIVLAVKRWN